MGKLVRFTSHSYLDTIDLKMLEKTLISPFDSSLLQDKDKDTLPTSIHEITLFVSNGNYIQQTHTKKVEGAREERIQRWLHCLFLGEWFSTYAPRPEAS